MNQDEINKKKINFLKLTPINNARLKIYDDALNFAFENNDIKNVAISGPYSAGKSSVIESYKRTSANTRFVHISLAHFPETHSNNSSVEEEKSLNSSETTTNNSSDNKVILEGKILNQLIHQIKPKKIPQTKFNVKQKAEPKKTIRSTILFILFLILVFYILSFKDWSAFVSSLNANWLKSILIWTINEITLLLSGLACFVILGIATNFLITIQKNKNILKRLRLQGNEIEIFEEKDDSVFDKYLNEVLYLFEHSNADAIVFEDMDRYNANEIFEKLREINTLINNKKAEEDEPPIRFLYLLRDDIFTSKDRTKFFDFIIPIVPVIDGSNSYDQLYEYLNKRELLKLFDEPFLQELSLYIDDMRILKNIINEFIIYHNRILFKMDEKGEEQREKARNFMLDSKLIELDNNKLLAIIAYKNIFPKDFSDLHLRSGFVYTLFENKVLLIENESRRIDEEISKIEELIQLSEDEMLESINELDALYLTFNYQIVSVGNKNISELNRTQLIKEMKDNSNSSYYNEYRHGYLQRTQLDIKSELEKLKKDPEYKKRKEAIERKNCNQIEMLKLELQKLIKQKNTVQNGKLIEFINKDNIDTIFNVTYTNEIGEKNTFDEIRSSHYFPLIKYLVRNGYIDENYSDYMTYFYENSLSRIDKNFLLSVTDQIPKDYSYSLNDPTKVLSRLKLGHFESVEILNFDLLKHLLKTKSDNEKYLSAFLHQLMHTKNYQFIGQFLNIQAETETKLLIKELNNMWPSIFQSIQEDSDFSLIQKKQYSIYTLYYSPNEDIEELNSNNCLTDFISNNPNFLDIEKPNIRKLIDGFCLLGIRFEWIDYETSNKDIFKEVYQKNFYQLTFDLITLMLEKIYGFTKNSDFNHKNYTLVTSKQEEPLARYVNDNFNSYIKVVLESCDKRITDDESVAVSIINDSKVDNDNKNMYISYLETVIKDIDSVKNKELWPLFMQEQIVNYTEDNILNYFFEKELDSFLINFINNSDSQLIFSSTIIDNKFGENSASKFFKALVKTNDLSNERYESILKGFRRSYSIFPHTEMTDEKMRILIKLKTIKMTVENLILMREHYSELLMPFIAHNISQYTDDVINEDNFEIEELLLVLDENVADPYKIRLLEFATDPISLKRKGYSNTIKLYILQHNFDLEDLPFLLESYTNENSSIMGVIEDISTQHIKEIISEGYFVPYELLSELFSSDQLEIETKKELFARCLPEMSERQVIRFLRTLQMEDFLSLFNRKRPKFRVNKVNKDILDVFKERKWITDFDIDNKDSEYYRAIGRKRRL